jgi:hypothetical protein
MPEEITQEVEEAEDDLLAALLADDEEEEIPEAEEAEEKFAKLDEKQAKRLNAVAEIVARQERERQADKLYKDFMADANDLEKETFSLYADDDMSPAQMRKAIMQAKKKASDIKAKLDSVDEERESVRRQAAEAWGLGPLQTSAGNTASDEQKELEDRIAKGDIGALSSFLWSSPPQVRR